MEKGIGKNIREFNLFTAELFSLLYDNFPNPVVVAPEEFDERADREAIKVYVNTMLFLKEEGFIRYAKVTPDNVFIDVVLTAKGLALLNLIPEGITEGKSLIQSLKEVLQEGSKVALKTLIDTLLKEGMRL